MAGPSICAPAGVLRWRCRGRADGACVRGQAQARVARPAIRHRQAASMQDCPAGCPRLARPVKVPQGRIEIRKFLACDPGLVLPFGDGRQAGQRAVHCAADIAQREPFGEGIDRLDQWKRGKAGFVDDTVGVNHLQHAVVEFGGTGDVSGLPDRQQFLQIVAARIEISEGDVAGIVVCVDAVGRARTVRRRGPCLSTVTETVTTWPGCTSRNLGRARLSITPDGIWNRRSTTRGASRSSNRA